MPEVHSVYATVRNPKPGTDDTGQVTTGYYTLADDVLTMTDSKGAAVRNSHTGEPFTQMRLGDDAQAIAKRLTMEVYRMLRGEMAPTVRGRTRARLSAVGVA
jgi:hypothetical protein